MKNKKLRILTWWHCKSIFGKDKNGQEINYECCEEYDDANPGEIECCASKCKNFVRLSVNRGLQEWYFANQNDEDDDITKQNEQKE